jgi:Fe-S-cluster containining protein
MLPARDPELVQIVDRALASATERGSSWLACRPGCTPCCHGVFRISQLDAERLRLGLSQLEITAPKRAAAIFERAHADIAILSAHFPGAPETGILNEEDEAWDQFADLPEVDGPCPVLDPATGLCELYAARPLTCRIFGPPVQNEDGIGVCELCYQGASESEILGGEMNLSHASLEAELDIELATTRLATAEAGKEGQTVIAWALAAPSNRSRRDEAS